MQSLVIVIIFISLLAVCGFFYARYKIQTTHTHVEDTFTKVTEKFGFQKVKFYKRFFAFGKIKNLPVSFAFYNDYQKKMVPLGDSKETILLRTKIPGTKNLKIYLVFFSQAAQIQYQATGWKQIEKNIWQAPRRGFDPKDGQDFIKKIPVQLKEDILQFVNEVDSMSFVHNHLVTQLGKDKALQLLSGDSKLLDALDVEIKIPINLSEDKMLNLANRFVDLVLKVSFYFKELNN